MSDKETLWEDSGFDCNHCGGEIHKRIDRELGHHKTTSFQCRQCHCQWSIHGALLTVGDMPTCQRPETRARMRTRTAVKASPAKTITSSLPELPANWLSNRIIAVLLAVVVGLFLLRFAGALLFRFFVPALILGAIGYLVFRMGQQQDWW